MSPEEQRIAIAEACPDLFVIGKSVFGLPHIYWEQDGKFQGAPVDPLNDLNAMHEAEKFIPPKKWIPYMNALRRVTETPDNGTEWDSEARNKMQWLSATAAQRAEAFLKTLGLWKV